MTVNKQKIVIVVGPTASGKTALAIKLAKQFNGYCISADSRQVYRGMDIATAKEPGKHKTQQSVPIYTIQNIPHCMIDIVNPDELFTLATWQQEVLNILTNSEQLFPNQLPLVVGGTGLYIASIVNHYQLPTGNTNAQLRKKLTRQSLPDLLSELQKLDPVSFVQIDINNKRKIVRALEYAHQTNSSLFENMKQSQSPFDILQIGIKIERDELYTRIDNRVERMFASGIVAEAEQLLQHYPADLPSMSGIGYQEIAQYLERKCALEQAKETIKKNSRNYAKRQLTWFKKDKRINWITDPEQATTVIDNFLQK